MRETVAQNLGQFGAHAVQQLVHLGAVLEHGQVAQEVERLHLHGDVRVEQQPARRDGSWQDVSGMRCEPQVREVQTYVRSRA